MSDVQPEPSYHIVRLRHHDPQLLESLDVLHRALMAYGGSDTPLEQFMDFVSKRLGDETMLLILGFAGETPVGYGMAFDVAEHPFMPEWQRSGYITQFFVAHEYRRQGVGQVLLDSIVQWLASRGVTKVLLNVSLENPLGNRFWRKQGFVPYVTRMKREI
jgi:GNAT superfamily N-acetyltransferase